MSVLLCNICILLCSIVLLQTVASADRLAAPAPPTQLKERFSEEVGLKAIQEIFSRNNTTGRIVFGKPAKPKQFRFVGFAVIFKTEHEAFGCTCSLISRTFVLFAAHCIDFEVLAAKFFFGSVNTSKFTQGRNASSVIKHSGYNAESHANDIALARLETPIMIDANVKLATLPTLSSRIESYAGKKLTPVGFGFEESGQLSQFLRYTTLKGQSDATCNAWFTGIPNLICAKSSDDSGICPGDSGGPLIYKKRVIGVNVLISSTVVEQENPAAICFGAKDAFTRVDKYLEWIQQYVNL